MEWIKCSERLPTECKDYLCYDIKRDPMFRIQLYLYSTHSKLGWCGCTDSEITHWMELPDEPTEEGENVDNTHGAN